MANEVHSKHSDLDQPEIISPRKYHTIPHHILNFTFVWAANACSASHNTALTDLFSPVWVFRES